MAVNQYEDAIDQLAQTPALTLPKVAPPPSAPEPDPNPYVGVVDAMPRGRRFQVQTALAQPDLPDPARAADILKLSKESGLPADVVARNYDRFKAGIEWN